MSFEGTSGQVCSVCDNWYSLLKAPHICHDKCRWCDRDERHDHEHGDHVYMPMSLVREIERRRNAT